VNPLPGSSKGRIVLIAALVFESPSLWPLVAVAVAALTLAVLWLYPSQLHGVGAAGWVPPLLRWMAIVALAISLLKPVILQPKSADQTGAIVVLLDCSKSMGVIDPGRTPAEQVALAGALGRLPEGIRSEVVTPLSDDLDRIESRAREVIGARSDLEYARVSGRGISEKQQRLHEVAERYAQAASVLSDKAARFSQGSELRQRLQEIEPVPPAEAEGWAEEVRRRIDRVQTAARALQSATDEQLYKSNPAVRSACDVLARCTRLDLSKAALIDRRSGLIAKLGDRDPIIGLAIDRGLSSIALSSNGRPVETLPVTADANESDLAGAVGAAMNGLANRPVRAVVLMSDGRQVGGRGDVTSALRPSGVPIFTVGVAAERTPDVSISNVSLSATSAFAGETLEGEADVTDDGGIKPPVELHVSSSTGQIVERLSPRTRRDGREHGREWSAAFAIAINPKDGAASERLVFSVPPEPGEATTANNQVERWIKVSSSQLKVALCTAAPTWDFQYLQSSMARRPWVRLSSEMLDPAHPRLGLTPAQILDQDVLVLSDIPVTALDVNQWDAVHSLVADRGGSVLLLAGTTFDIADYSHQPIARSLLPFHDVRPIWKEWPGEQPSFHFMPTPLGEREALRLGDGSDDARRWQDLPGAFRFLQIPDTSLYPDVRPLLLEAEGGGAVLTERRVGAGLVLFLGMNETWRWRLKGAERDADRFWRQLIRHAGGEPYAVTRGGISLDTDKVAARPGVPVHVRAHIRQSGSIRPSACMIQILQGEKLLSTRQLPAIGGGRFAGEISDLPEGDYQLQLRGPPADRSGDVRVPLHIADSDEAEMRDVSGDRDMLVRIARSSGGQYLPIDQVDRLADRIKALHETESQFARHPIWNSPLFFGFVLACFAGEWALRKRFGLA
jgi:hypothetical protein